MIAEACLVAGFYDKGLEEVYRGMSFASETGVQFEVPRLRLLQGELLLHASTRNFEIAQGCFVWRSSLRMHKEHAVGH